MNKAILIGNVGTDPELKKTTNGSDVASLSLATNKTYLDKSGQKQQETQWHRLTFYGKSALTINQYVKKGAKIAVEGEIKNNSYTDTNGVQKFFSEVVIDKFEFLGGNGTNGNGSGQNTMQAPKEQYAENKNAGQAPAQQQQQQQSAQASSQDFGYKPNEDVEDLPF